MFAQSNTNSVIPAINETQKRILEGYLQFPFEEIVESLSDEIESSSLIINAYKTMVSPGSLPEILPGLLTRSTLIFSRNEVWGSIEAVRKLFRHPCPQNRRVGDSSAASGSTDGIINNEVYYWEDGFGGILKHEQQGLLGLTAKNDSSALPITKDAVINYTIQLINQQIKLFEILGVYVNEFNQIQFASNDKEMVITTILANEKLAVKYFQNIDLIKDTEVFTSTNLKLLTNNIKYSYSTLQVMEYLKNQGILNSNNFKKLMDYVQFSNFIISKSMTAPLTQEKFDSIIEECREKMHMSLIMGLHPRIGTGSSLYSVFQSGFDNTVATVSDARALCNEVFKFI